MDKTIAPSQTRPSESRADGAAGPIPQRDPSAREDEAADCTATAAWEGSGSPAPTPRGDPSTIGRYRIIRWLGRGGFGRVYLARDDVLDRLVAVKVPNPERVAGPEDVETYLIEARTLAKLDHPHIVPVYDVGRTDDGLCYVVSKYVEGSDLAERMRRGRPAPRESAELVATVAEALHHAHTRGLVHRDIKPANILLDGSGAPCVADFGLALKDEDYGRGARLAGTPAYMSPEQARGEGHRVDGRSDVFSLGVVFYELLTGRKPFRGETPTEVMAEIARAEERPPRQVDDTIPRELERVCQKMLAKRASERYSTARDVADDLRHFFRSEVPAGARPALPSPSATAPGSAVDAIPTPGLVRPDPPSRPAVKVVPKGLRSFDRDDADFFLELLPGPRDRDGLPDSLRFWKTRVETTDPDAAFKVGLIYGPSGCGKSSLVKAGLLPRLAGHVVPVYVEATPQETEVRLARAVRKACPDLAPRPGLVELLAALRRGKSPRSGQKVLVVLDQFEQWLFAKQNETDTELVAALRQCDGERLQAIVMIRDDFWLAASRFMRDLEVDLEANANIALVDLFDLQHARKVLIAFGRAYGKMPERDRDHTREQIGFLDQAIAGLAQEGKVVSVRLALFAEMIKGKPWTPATLRDVGGTQGVGVTFLEETFASPQANPRHHLHQKAAQAALEALLPQTGTDIKGQMRSEGELRDASGYAGRHRDFVDLMHILDSELRLITPTDPDGSGEGPSARLLGGPYYQLTHDYMVHSLRAWLTRKQRETRRGRAELRLAERATIWTTKPENRHLPSVPEWATIRLLTKRRDWTEPQHRLMQRAGRVHRVRGLVLAILIGLLTWGGIEGYGTLRASALVESLKTASTIRVPDLIEQLRPYRRWARRPFADLLSSTENDSDPHLRASLASLALWPGDARRADYLYHRLLRASPVDLLVIWRILHRHHQGIQQRLWSVLDDPDADPDQRFRAACALANTESAPVENLWDAVLPFITERLLAGVIKNPGDYSRLIEILRPLRKPLVSPLSLILQAPGRSESERSFATTILADYAAEEPDVLAELLMAAGAEAYGSLFPVAERQAVKILPLFQAEIAKGLTSGKAEDSEQVKDILAGRQARAAIALIRLGHADAVWPLLRHSADPRLRSFLVNWLSPLGADPRILASELDHVPARAKPVPARGQHVMDAVLLHPETSLRRALILALGTYGTKGLSPGEREPLIAKLLDLYRHDPDSGIHGAAEWTLRQWGQQARIRTVDSDLARLEGKDRGERRWYVNGQGQTFIIVEGPVDFRMGSPPDDAERFADEPLHQQPIARRFAIATKEVTLEQYQEFTRKYPQFGLSDGDIKQYGLESDRPIIGVNWFIATAYCNWLSEREGIARDQWCYLPNKQANYDKGLTIPASSLRREGYRLPTDVEWEYACRAGTLTSRYYGRSLTLLDRYAWNLKSAGDLARVQPCGRLLPNDLGLFDMLGNAYEWCHEPYSTSPEVRDSLIDIIVDDMPGLLRGGPFSYPPAYVRSAFRYGSSPSDRDIFYGFRPARTCR